VVTLSKVGRRADGSYVTTEVGTTLRSSLPQGLPQGGSIKRSTLRHKQQLLA
jgi:hypothetical protein